MTALTPTTLRDTELPRTRVRYGYKIDEVDAFIREIAHAWEQKLRVDSGPVSSQPLLTRDDILNKMFSVSRFTEGYEMDAVDDLLNKVFMSWLELEAEDSPDHGADIDLSAMSTQSLLALNTRISDLLAKRMGSDS